MSLILSEFDCTCCGKNEMQQGTFDRFVLAREYANVPFIVNSGYRCPKRNADPEVGSSETSSHPKGFAGDIRSVRSRHRWHLIDGLYRAGFERIGVGTDFIHADDDPDKDPAVIWLY